MSDRTDKEGSFFLVSLTWLGRSFPLLGKELMAQLTLDTLTGCLFHDLDLSHRGLGLVPGGPATLTIGMSSKAVACRAHSKETVHNGDTVEDSLVWFGFVLLFIRQGSQEQGTREREMGQVHQHAGTATGLLWKAKQVGQRDATHFLSRNWLRIRRKLAAT